MRRSGRDAPISRHWATKEVVPARMPAHSATAPAELTPSTGRNSGMIGLSIENAAVMTNWIPTIAHKVRCHGTAALVSVPAVFSSVVALRNLCISRLQ